EIEHREIERSATVDDLAHHALHRREAQIALQFIDRGAAAVLIEQTYLVCWPASFRAHGREGIAGAYGRYRRPGRMQAVQTQIVGQRFAHRDAAHAVAALVECRREYADAELSRQHRDDAAAHTA